MLNNMLNFAKGGYHVFPLLKRLQRGENKRGTPIGWNHNNPDHKYAIESTTDTDTILGWFHNYKDIIGYGVNPRNERALILDVDVGGEKVGLKSFQRLISEYQLSKDTLIVKTKSGGLHLYYNHPDFICSGEPMKNFPDIDTRSSNNFVVGPGSFDESYSIVNGSPLQSLADLPETILKFVPKKMSLASTSSLVALPDDITLNGEIPKVIAYGERDNTLLKLIGSWVRQGLSRKNVILLTQNALDRCDNPDKDKISIDDYITKIDSTFGKESFTKPLAEPLEFFLNNAIYVRNHGAVYEIPGRVLRTKELINLYAPMVYYIEDPNGKTKELSAYKQWLKHKKRKSVDGFGYHPISDHIVKDDIQKCEVVNMYRPPTISEEKFKPNIQEDKYDEFLEFCEYLFGSKTDFMLDWAAHQIQKPNEKLAIAPVMVSESRGVGKNLFFDLMSACVGKHNVAIFNTERVAESHNDYILRTHLVLVNESYIDIKDRWTRKSRNHLVENIKMLITDHAQDVNPKFVTPFIAKSYVNYIFASNNVNAIPIDNHDRRFEVIIIQAKPKDHEYYKNLWSIVDNENLAYYIRKRLSEREIKLVSKGFTAHIVDEHKKLVIDANKSRVEEEIELAIENKSYVFYKDIVTFELFAWYVTEKVDPSMRLENIRLLLKQYCKPIYTPSTQKVKNVRQAMVDYPALTDRGQFIPGGKKRCPLYTCRNYEYYKQNRDDIQPGQLTLDYNDNMECTISGQSKITKIA